jgi:hypothetical protein
MSRTDSPKVPPGGWPAQRPQAAPPQNAPGQGEYDLAGWTQGLGGVPVPNPKPQQAAPQGYPQQQGYGQQPAEGGYGHSDQGYYWGADPQAPPAPQFDPYVPQTTPSRRPVQPAPNGYGAAPSSPQNFGAQPQQPAQNGYGAAPPPQNFGAQPQQPAYNPNYAGYPDQAAPALRGSQYDQWAAAAEPASDPRGYDLASYMPPQGRPPQQPPVAAPDYGHLTADLATHPQPGYADWGHQSGYQQAPQGYGGQQQYDPAAFGAQPGYDQQAYADPNAQGYEDDGYDVEEPARSRKWMTVAAALVGAIVVGGGLTYAYQSLLGDSGGGPTPVVRSAEGPSKVKPSEPGGKQFANTDSKLLGRLGDSGGSSAPLSDADSAGTRKVQTLVVGRDGAIQAPGAPPDAVDVPAVSVPVPGMTLIDVPSPGSAPAAQRPQPIVVQPPVQPPAQPVQVAANDPPSTAPVLPKSLNSESAVPVAEKPKPKSAPKPVTKTAALPDAAASSAPAKAAAPSGLGYVAVLASVPASGTSRIDALQQFADLQQRYGGILQNKTPDVTEANLGEKGRYHRLVVGPPGSKDGANSVCSQLKTAGYSSCWVMAY